MIAHAKTDACSPSCTFAGTADAVPFADALVTTSTGSSASLNSGGLTGSLWSFGPAWSPKATVDHDTTGGGIVKSSAVLSAPDLKALVLTGTPAVDGLVKVSAFTATASTVSGYTTATAPAAPTATTVKLWDGASYRSVSWVPGTALNQNAGGSLIIGNRQVSFTTSVQALPVTYTAVGSAPRTEVIGEYPSVLIVTIAVTVTPSTLVAPTTTTTTTTTTTPTSTTLGATTTTEAPIPPPTDAFTVVIDYGRVSANGTWQA
jgi:hypothetical protein